MYLHEPQQPLHLSHCIWLHVVLPINCYLIQLDDNRFKVIAQLSRVCSQRGNVSVIKAHLETWIKVLINWQFHLNTYQMQPSTTTEADITSDQVGYYQHKCIQLLTQQYNNIIRPYIISHIMVFFFLHFGVTSSAWLYYKELL